jgi:hypothetical protein
MTELAEQHDGSSVVVDSLLGVSVAEMDGSQARESLGLGCPIAVLAGQRERILEMPGRLLPELLPFAGAAEVG